MDNKLIIADLTPERIRDIAHKAMRLWVLMYDCNIDCLRIRQYKDGFIHMAAKPFLKTKFYKVKPFHDYHKTYTYKTTNVDLMNLLMYATSCNKPHIIGVSPYVGNLYNIKAKAALFDIFTTEFKHGFVLDGKEYFTKPGEIEEKLINYDMTLTETDVKCEESIVESIEFFKTCHKYDIDIFDHNKSRYCQ